MNETYPAEQAPTAKDRPVEMDERTAGARQCGRITFFEIADLHGEKEAADLMLRVVRMSPLLSEKDVANWVNAYRANN